LWIVQVPGAGTKRLFTRYHGCSRFSEAAFSGQQLAHS
jgi:hypothetical protein